MTKKQTQKRVGGLMPIGLVRKLDSAAKCNDRSIAAEMRIRLEQTFTAEAPRTRASAPTTTNQ